MAKRRKSVSLRSVPQPSKQQLKDLHDELENEFRPTHTLFCLRDIEAEGFGLPQPAINAALFIREMELVFKNPEHPITKYPDKFEIYECGAFDYRLGVVTGSKLRRLGLVSDFAPKPVYNEPVVQRP